MHLDGHLDLMRWMLDMKIKWFGFDAGSGDLPLWTTIRSMRPDVTRLFEDKVGVKVDEFFPSYEYQHKLSGRHIKNDLFPFHNWAFSEA